MNHKNNSKYIDNNSSLTTYYNDFDKNFYCERYFKKISEEEYEFNDGMCKNYYEDVVVNHQDDIFIY